MMYQAVRLALRPPLFATPRKQWLKQPPRAFRLEVIAHANDVFHYQCEVTADVGDAGHHYIRIPSLKFVSRPSHSQYTADFRSRR